MSPITNHHPPASAPVKSRCKRLGLILAWGFSLLLLTMSAGCFWALRDRHPDYSLNLSLPSMIPTNSNPVRPSNLRAGFGRASINPEIGPDKAPVYIAGFGQNRVATAIHDDLWSLACVIDDGATRVGLVALDAIGFFYDDVIRVRQRLSPDWGLDYVVVCSTHNHNTPDLIGLWGPNYLKSGVDQAYLDLVIAATVQSLGRAVESLHPAQVTFHEIPTPSEGLVEDARRPVVFDPNIRLMLFEKPASGEILGSVVTWANHPETVWSKNTEITADFPGYLREALASGVTLGGVLLEPGLGGTHVYINGAVGGLMTTSPRVTVHDPYLQQDFQEPTHAKTQALGRQLAWRIFRHLDAAEAAPQADPRLEVEARTLEIPLANKGYLVAPMLGLIDRGHVRWKQLRSEVALLRFGDASVACIPGEIYPEIVNGGIENPPGADFKIAPVEEPPIRDMMPGTIKFVFGLANDEIGYIIPKSQWDQKKPYLYGSESAVYGEINSCGPEVGPLIHRAFREICR